MKLNLGSGESKLDGFINIDAEPETHPDVCMDFRYESLPCQDNEADEVWMLHCLEHVERRYWDGVFKEIRRVLKPQGMLVLAYPEFRVCVDYYLRNVKDSKPFWLNTIFGRQFWPSDYHVTACDSEELKQYLMTVGFYRPEAKREPPPDEYNSVLVAFKAPFISRRDEVIAHELGLTSK